MRRAAAGEQHLLLCQKLGGQLPILTTCHLRPCIGLTYLQKSGGGVHPPAPSVLPSLLRYTNFTDSFNLHLLLMSCVNSTIQVRIRGHSMTTWTQFCSFLTTYLPLRGYFHPEREHRPHCAKVQKYEQGKIGLQFFDMWC